MNILRNVFHLAVFYDTLKQKTSNVHHSRYNLQRPLERECLHMNGHFANSNNEQSIVTVLILREPVMIHCIGELMMIM